MLYTPFRGVWYLRIKGTGNYQTIFQRSERGNTPRQRGYTYQVSIKLVNHYNQQANQSETY
ncbi:hypothetical protein [Capnocytophaga bilenii]|uniref:hypothetical protein n=1 Tax=Capnocytophaga bilenii TaxID=2819369 RepID=UPI0028D5F00A|nr:hypothetical protein [Capnocytophaga bilenii]